MASITIRLTELAEFLGWEVKPLELLEWIKSQLVYLPPDCRSAVENYFTQEKYEDEYFKINSGRTALYSLYRQSIMGYDFTADMKQAVDDYYVGWQRNKDKGLLKRAFYLAEYLAQISVKREEIIDLCLKAAIIGCDAKEWEATYKIAMRPFQWGYVEKDKEEKLNKLAACARKEMRHKQDYPEVD